MTYTAYISLYQYIYNVPIGGYELNEDISFLTGTDEKGPKPYLSIIPSNRLTLDNSQRSACEYINI